MEADAWELRRSTRHGVPGPGLPKRGSVSSKFRDRGEEATRGWLGPRRAEPSWPWQLGGDARGKGMPGAMQSPQGNVSCLMIYYHHCSWQQRKLGALGRQGEAPRGPGQWACFVHPTRRPAKAPGKHPPCMSVAQALGLRRGTQTGISPTDSLLWLRIPSRPPRKQSAQPPVCPLVPPPALDPSRVSVNTC